MKYLYAVLLILITVIILPTDAHAIIFLPALILIPIAKIIALIVAGFSLPALSFGVIWSKVTKNSLKRTLIFIAVLLIFIAVIIGSILKIANPERPLF